MSYPVAQVIPEPVYSVVEGILEDRHLSLDERDRKLQNHAPVLYDFLKPRLNAGNLDQAAKDLLRVAMDVAKKAFIPASVEDYSRASRRRDDTVPVVLPSQERPPGQWSKLETILRTGQCCLLPAPAGHEWQNSDLGGNHVHRRLRSHMADANRQVGTSQGSCTKNKTGNGLYIPGCIFFWCADCSRCLYFGVMKNSESPRTVFEAIYTHWETAPELIVYDNACNLHNFFLNREPVFFKDTRFNVDASHYLGHSKCNPGYNSKRYNDVKNSALAEQKNRLLRLLETQAICMGQVNFIRFVRYFVYRLNQREGQIERGECFYIQKKPRTNNARTN